MFKITSEDKKTNARTGLLKTARGVIETPFFMPVATKATVKHISPEELKKINVKAVISNALLLYLNPGLNVIKKFKGIHNFMDFDGIVFTDSGGFQVLNDDLLIRINDSGAIFKSPFDGKKHNLTPELAIKIQNTINSDVIMCLDDVPKYGSSRERIIESMQRTHKWAGRCLKSNKNKKQLIFGIAQGGTFPELRKKSTEFISSLDFDGVSLGGLCIGEPHDLMYRMVGISNKIIPEEKPRYLMGVGGPLNLIESVSHGVDIFDSAFPTRNARHGSLFTKTGEIKILNKKYKNDTKPIEKDCGCYACQNFSRAYIRFQLKMNEGIGMRLATLHNIYFIQNLMEEVRSRIKENEFLRFKKGVSEGI